MAPAAAAIIAGVQPPDPGDVLGALVLGFVLVLGGLAAAIVGFRHAGPAGRGDPTSQRLFAGVVVVEILAMAAVAGDPFVLTVLAFVLLLQIVAFARARWGPPPPPPVLPPPPLASAPPTPPAPPGPEDGAGAGPDEGTGAG